MRERVSPWAGLHRYHPEDQFPGELVVPSPLSWRTVNGIVETSCDFWSAGGFWGIKHERTFSNWMGGKKIVRRKSWRLHRMLYIFISQDKVEQQQQEIVLFPFMLCGRMHWHLWSQGRRPWDPRGPERQRQPQTLCFTSSTFNLQTSSLSPLYFPGVHYYCFFLSSLFHRSHSPAWTPPLGMPRGI